jgi:hypothetical protein
VFEHNEEEEQPCKALGTKEMMEKKRQRTGLK